jgi:short-subunit dehydrogenase
MKKAIIIGASSGIGEALAMLLAANGFKVGVTGRRTSMLDNLVARKPDLIYSFPFDVTDNENLSEKLNQLTAELGGLDLIIYSAGIGELNSSLNLNLELSTIDVNVKAFNSVTVWAYHYFEKQKNGQIVVISSIAGLRGGAIAPAYNASKAYQINYLEGLRQKAKKHKTEINIIDVRPGFVDTAMAKAEEKFWVSTPEKAALQIYDAIKAKKSVIYITKRWRIIAWLLKLIPRSLYERM